VADTAVHIVDVHARTVRYASLNFSPPTIVRSGRLDPRTVHVR
jgi:hypothetical protein